jgi:hypothetical protein
MNVFHQAFPDAIVGQALDCAFAVKAELWPPVPGEYVVCCPGEDCFVAVSTLGSLSGGALASWSRSHDESHHR